MIFYCRLENPVPAARPRVYGRVAVTPKHYRNWKRYAANELYEAATTMGFERADQPHAVRIVLGGKLRGDIDNYAKAILDACTDAGVWSDDKLVHELRIKREPDVDDEPHAFVEVKWGEE